jgi:cytochrome c-type biogenesis protein CcmH/NrfG
MAVFRVAQMWSVAPHVLNVIVAVFSSLDTKVYQSVRTEQKALDDPEADRSQQNCDSMPPLWHLEFCKTYVPQV